MGEGRRQERRQGGREGGREGGSEGWGREGEAGGRGVPVGCPSMSSFMSSRSVCFVF